MKQIFKFFSSTRLMAILLSLFAISIAVATFIENDFGTDTARKLVYNAKWFEILFLLGSINIVAVMISAKMFKKQKLTLLLFHLSFLLIMAGAATTRYFGREGNMHIREGETTSEWNTTSTHLGVFIRDQNATYAREFPVLFAPATRNTFKKRFSHAGHRIRIRVTEFIPNAERVLLADPEGLPYLHIVTTTGMGRQDVILTTGQNLKTPSFTLNFVEKIDTLLEGNQVQVESREGVLYYYANFPVTRLVMGTDEQQVLEGGKIQPFLPSMLHYFDQVPLVVKQYLPAARIDAQPATLENERSVSAVRMSISCDKTTRSTVAFGSKDQVGQYSLLSINGVEIAVNYGPIVKSLPFKLRLNDFIIKRYPGSESPSWYESNVQLIDDNNGVDRKERVYMNHILKYRGYRFYQSSYDTDERGTVLSINRDGPGTKITYLGYFLMALGMLLSLVNRKSRFARLAVKKDFSSPLVKSLILFVLLTTGLAAEAQEKMSLDSLPVIPVEKAKDFGTLLVQDNGGRIEPMNTLASEVLRKVSRKEEYKGQNAEQVLAGMLVFPDHWQHERMIRVGHEEIRQILGIESNYASFVDFFKADNHGGYILRAQVEEAYRKKPAYRSKFDNEIIRVDERLNVAYLVYTGAVLRMFPDPKDTTHTWHAPGTAGKVFTDKDSVFSTRILSYYCEEVPKAIQSGDWNNADEIVKAIKIFQSNYGQEVMPSHARIKAEIFYNKSNLYSPVYKIYLLIGLILLILQFIHIFVSRFSLKIVFKIAFFIIFAAFLFHSLALGLRWYVSGHAPWSNGYEALTFIAWGTVLAGILFSRRAEIALSATAILAALILQTAHLSWMDPQITNLVPVLQSYWLVIHVAVITISYSFLGLGAMLALVNMLLLFFQSNKNYDRLDVHINQLSSVIEMTLITGLYLLTIGTFLGGVWANESWGRYWAWDPKETWALVTVIVYAIILHLRLVKGLKGRVLFNIAALVGFASVLMTYFGVNYYLSGLHSYAKGDPVPVPPIVYYSVATVLILALLVIYNQSRLKKTLSK